MLMVILCCCVVRAMIYCCYFCVVQYWQHCYYWRSVSKSGKSTHNIGGTVLQRYVVIMGDLADNGNNVVMNNNIIYIYIYGDDDNMKNPVLASIISYCQHR